MIVCNISSLVVMSFEAAKRPLILQRVDKFFVHGHTGDLGPMSQQLVIQNFLSLQVPCSTLGVRRSFRPSRCSSLETSYCPTPTLRLFGDSQRRGHSHLLPGRPVALEDAAILPIGQRQTNGPGGCSGGRKKSCVVEPSSP